MTKGRWRVERASPVLETAYFDVLRSKVRRPDGSLADYHTVDFHQAAVGVVLRDQGRILLIRQQRFIVDRDVWAVPSGGVEAGETPAQAALRELVEETGYRAASVRHVVSWYPSYGVTNQVFHGFLAEDAVAVDAHDANEVDGVAWFDEDAVRAMIVRGDIPDGLSLTPIVHLLAGLPLQPDAEIARCRRVTLATPEEP